MRQHRMYTKVNKIVMLWMMALQLIPKNANKEMMKALNTIRGKYLVVWQFTYWVGIMTDTVWEEMDKMYNWEEGRWDYSGYLQANGRIILKHSGKLIVKCICQSVGSSNLFALYYSAEGNKTHDWDILILTQHWPLTVCLQWKESLPQHSCNLKNFWTVHGIW